MQKQHLCIAFAAAVLLLAGKLWSQATQAESQPAYLNPALPVDQRVDDLVSRMTLEEKIGQMNISWATGYEGTRQGVLGGEPEACGLVGNLLVFRSAAVCAAPRAVARSPSCSAT